MEKKDENRLRVRAYELWEAAGKPEGQDEIFWRAAERELNEGAENDKLDEALKETFPASDPASTTYRTSNR